MERINQILLVDDDSTTNFEHQKALKESGIVNNVKVALNGGHAFLYLNQMYSNPESDAKLLILLDMDMPIMNGYEFLQNYNKCNDINKENIIIVLMTTSSDPDEVAIKSLGVNYYIPKPLCPEALKNALYEHFSFKIAS